MIKWGRQSRGNIEELCSPLQVILHAYADVADPSLDLTIIEGHRNEERQMLAYNSGKSKVKFPHSKHNKTPSQAFDFIPAPFHRKGWSDGYRFARIAGGLITVAHMKGFRLRWGGDWDLDGSSDDENFLDLGHIELHGSL